MLDDWFSYLLIETSEKEVMPEIAAADIVGGLDRYSLPLQYRNNSLAY
jgi:hypothetical protein